ncbi:MAG: hypothetical protein AAF611_20850 [Bacteroidota bacterium]
MKKILFIVFAALFSVSVSAHEHPKSFQQQFGTTPIVNTTSYASMHTLNNGGLIHFIYRIFHKVGQSFYNSTTNDSQENNDTNKS